MTDIETDDPRPIPPNHPLRFELRRNESAAGHDTVATGVQFGDGVVVLRWLGEYPSTVVFAHWGDVMRVHHIGEHGSKQWTTAVWLDGVCFACGSHLPPNGHAMAGGNGTQCWSCSAAWEGPPSRMAGGAGVWKGLR